MASWTGLAAYILGFGSVEDSDAKILEAAGFAKTFGMYSIWHQQFSGKYGVDKGVALFDDYKYTWGDIKCSRAPKGAAGEWAVLHDAVTDSDGYPLPGLSIEMNHPQSTNHLSSPVPRRKRRRRERDGWR